MKATDGARLEAVCALLALADEPSLPRRRHVITQAGRPDRYAVWLPRLAAWHFAARRIAQEEGA